MINNSDKDTEERRVIGLKNSDIRRKMLENSF